MYNFYMLKKIIIFTTLVILLLMVVVYSYTNESIRERFQNPEEQKITLTYWGVLYPEEVMNSVIKDYEALNPNVNIVYTQQKFDSIHSLYKQFLINRFESGNVSGLVEMHSTWLPEFVTKISLDNNNITREEFNNRFYPVALNQHTTTTGKTIGIPMNYDGLMLIYNKDHYNDLELTVPVTWDDFKTNAQKLSIRNSDGFERYGAAMGGSSNVTHLTDILAVMLTQNRVVIPQRLDSPLSNLVFRNYLDYRIGSNPTWSLTANEDYKEFARGKLSMMFATLDTVKKIKEINRTINIGYADLPQLPLEDGSTSKVGFASYYSITVNKNLSNLEETIAWDFANWLSEQDQQIALNTKLVEFNNLDLPYIYSNKNINNRYLDSRYADIFKPLIETASIALSNQMAGGVGNNEISQLFINLIDTIEKDNDLKDLEKLLPKLQSDYLKLMSNK